MDRKTIDYLHNALLDWALWLADGRVSQGMFPNHIAVASGEARRATKKPNPLSPHQQPKSTRIQAGSRPLIHRIDKVSELIHPIVLSQDIPVKEVVSCLYILKLPFQDTSAILGISSRRVGENRHKVLKSIDLVL